MCRLERKEEIFYTSVVGLSLIQISLDNLNSEDEEIQEANILLLEQIISILKDEAWDVVFKFHDQNIESVNWSHQYSALVALSSLIPYCSDEKLYYLKLNFDYVMGLLKSDESKEIKCLILSRTCDKLPEIFLQNRNIN